ISWLGWREVCCLKRVWSEIKLDQSPSEVKRPGERVKILCTLSGYSLTSYKYTGYDRGQAELWSGLGI
uniref:Ig-like domain-containing protein n=1 Tax=Pundamilia nyererei TaxID=303518 RepID=A0A3B4HBF3_9CICH